MFLFDSVTYWWNCFLRLLLFSTVLYLTFAWLVTNEDWNKCFINALYLFWQRQAAAEQGCHYVSQSCFWIIWQHEQSYESPLHTAHLFSRLCHVTWCFEHCFFFSFFFSSKHTCKTVIILIPYVFRVQPATPNCYHVQFSQITQGNKSNYTSAVPSINTTY